MRRNVALLRFSRQVHLYFGLFISPALIFFAITGGYQTLGLHEASSNYTPPRALAVLGQIHKKQTQVLPNRRGGGPEAGRPQRSAQEAGGAQAGGPDAGHDAAGARGGGKERDGSAPRASGASAQGGRSGGNAPAPLTLEAKQRQHLPLKLFFLLVSFGLLVSTLTGVYMAYRYDRRKMVVTAILALGVVVPAILLRF